MTDPYREAAQACPVCRTGMRAFQGRLVCDHCTGMLLTIDDFTRSITASELVTVTDDTITQRACPRCDALMKSCRVVLGTFEIDVEILHCERDGLWFGGGILEDALAKIGRHGHHGSGSRGGLVGSGIGGVGAHGLGAAMQAVNSAFARGSSDPNEPLKWWEKTRPRVVTPFASVLAALHLACPECAGRLHLHGNQWGCDAGDGVFVENLALTQMISEMANGPWELPDAVGPSGTRSCPACNAAMIEQEIEGVLVHRCGAHGVWFHTGELERALQHTGEPKAGWFRRLFWRR